jgi:hypothetical protein
MIMLNREVGDCSIRRDCRYCKYRELKKERRTKASERNKFGRIKISFMNFPDSIGAFKGNSREKAAVDTKIKGGRVISWNFILTVHPCEMVRES